MLKDMGWRSLVEEVTIMANQGGRTLLSNISDLKAYLAEWRRESGTSGEVENVDDLIQWKLHSPKALCNICRIGSWLGDCVHTESRVGGTVILNLVVNSCESERDASGPLNLVDGSSSESDGPPNLVDSGSSSESDGPPNLVVSSGSSSESDD